MKVSFKRFKNFRRALPKRASEVNKRRKVVVKRTYSFTQAHPFRALFIVLFLFLLLMILGNTLLAPKKTVTQTPNNPKVVKVYKIGSAPEITYQGKIEKSGVVKIVAQTPGIVSNINVSEGQSVVRGTNILSLSTNYSGGNAMSIARQIAGSQYANAKNTYDDQKQIIAKQRELADKNRDNAGGLRSITAQSATDTQGLASLDQDIVNGIQSNINNLEATNVGGINDAAILQAKEGLAQFKAALVQATSSYKTLQVQSNTNSADTAALQHDIAIKQLDIQEKTLQMTLDIAGLQLRMAQVNEATMFPSSPFSGVVERIFVHEGDSVNPGTPLAQISGDSQHAEVIVSVPDNIARRVSSFEPSTLFFEEQTIHLMPTYVSRDSTSGTLYSIIYDLGDLSIANLTNEAFIQVKVPIGIAKTTNLDPYVPLDAITQTQEEAFVYVVDSQNIARAKKVTLGTIQGRFVEVLTGIPQNAQVILDRNVIDGDRVAPQE